MHLTNPSGAYLMKLNLIINYTISDSLQEEILMFNFAKKLVIGFFSVIASTGTVFTMYAWGTLQYLLVFALFPLAALMWFYISNLLEKKRQARIEQELAEMEETNLINRHQRVI